METNNQIYTLIPKIMEDVGAVSKTRKNPQQGYMFRGIDEVLNAMHGVLAKHGVFFVPKVTRREREERQTKSGGNLIYTVMDVEFTFYAPDGSNVTATTTGEAMDSGDKSCNKAMSAALKYALFDVFCIPTEETKDTEAETHDVVPKGNPYREKFLDDLDAALDRRQFNGAAASAAATISGMMKKKYKVDLDGVTPDIGQKIIGAIDAGKFDNLKGQEAAHA